MSLSKQVESNECQIAKMRDVLDSLAMTTAESLERSKQLETRFDDELLDTLGDMKNNNKVDEQIDQLETSVAVLQASLKEELTELKSQVPTWAELNEIAKPPAERSASGNDDTIKQRGKSLFNPLKFKNIFKKWYTGQIHSGRIIQP